MPQSLAQAYLHVIYSTKNRVPCLSPEIRRELEPYMGKVLSNLGCAAIEAGAVSDHIHFLCRQSRTVTIAELLEESKKPTSKWLKTKSPSLAGFSWQRGYGAFSISPSHVPDLVRYIKNQEEHHKTVTFQDEMRRFFRLYEIEYDERYVWD